MSEIAPSEAEKNIEIWKVKKLIKRLEAARGNGTSMISLIIPPKDQVSRAAKMLAEEYVRTTDTHTPAEGPVTTASGRQVRAPSRLTVDQSNNIVSTSPDQDIEARATSKESSLGPTGRPRRSAAVNHGLNGWTSSRNRGYNSMDDEYDSDASEPELGDDEEEYDQGADEADEDEDEFDEDEEMIDDDLDDSPKSMIVKLKMPQKDNSKLDFEQFRYHQSDSKPSLASHVSPEKERPSGTPISTPLKNQSNISPMPSAQSFEKLKMSEQRTSVAPAQPPTEAEIKVASSIATADNQPLKEDATEHSISMVPGKQGTPQAENQEFFAAPAAAFHSGLPPLTPSYNPLQSNSLAFRESPEKPHHVQPVKPLDPRRT